MLTWLVSPLFVANVKHTTIQYKQASVVRNKWQNKTFINTQYITLTKPCAIVHTSGLKLLFKF